jgi:DNA-binding MarR family transcriptional regulator
LRSEFPIEHEYIIAQRRDQCLASCVPRVPAPALAPFGKDFGITEPQLNILRLLVSNPNAIAQTVADVRGMTRRNVENHISRLKKIGLLEREGGRKNGRWIVRRPE